MAQGHRLADDTLPTEGDVFVDVGSSIYPEVCKLLLALVSHLLPCRSQATVFTNMHRVGPQVWLRVSRLPSTLPFSSSVIRCVRQSASLLSPGLTPSQKASISPAQSPVTLWSRQNHQTWIAPA